MSIRQSINQFNSRRRNHIRTIPNHDYFIFNNMKRFITNNYFYAIRDAIIHKKFNLNSTWQNGFSMLHFAVKEKKYQITEMLLNLGIDRTIMCNIEGQTALHLACMNGFISIIRLMISKGREDLELFDRYGKTPLIYAYENGHKPVAKFLIENGASTTYLDQNIVNELVQTREDREFARRMHRLDQEIYFERRLQQLKISLLKNILLY